MATAMDTIINSHKVIFQAMEIMATMATTDSMVIQAIDHKTIFNQHPLTTLQTTNTFLHSPMHHNSQTINIFHQLIMVIAQMATVMVISIHKMDIDTKMTSTIPFRKSIAKLPINTMNDANYSFRLRSIPP